MEIKIKRTIAILLAICFLVSVTATAVTASEFKESNNKIKFDKNRVDKLGHDGLFYEKSTGSPTSLKWDFGDGTHSTSKVTNGGKITMK